MPFTPDEIRNLPVVLSAPRFATYLQAMEDDHEQALELYEWNLSLSAAFIIPLQICEVAVRNGVVHALETTHGSNWPWSQGFIRSLPQPKNKYLYSPSHDLQAVANRMPTTGKVVAGLKFAFWEKLFTAGQDSRLWNSYFHAAFPGAPKTIPIATLRKTMFNNLKNTRKLRNRIAHHEPIFKRDISTDYINIHEMVAWRNPVAATWMHKKQAVTRLITAKPT